MARPKGTNVVNDLINGNFEPVKKETKKKYSVNIVFDGVLEKSIREKAKENGMGVATYIKMLVSKDLNK